ncbi:MAG: hypothetical protein ACK4J0_00810 [Candidatus Anstonellaceae archaeon]
MFSFRFNDYLFFFILFFIALSIIASNISISKLWGAEGQTFSLFEFFSPLPAAFLGPAYGILVVLIAKGFAILFSPTPFNLTTFLRFIPPIVGAYIFSKFKENFFNSVLNSLICFICIGLFIFHPVGSKAWLFSIFWFIPIALNFVKSNHIFFRALATTLTQHAVGGVIWIYFVSPANPEFWLALIPLVAIERLVFASGIALSYLGSLRVFNFFNNFVLLRYFRKTAVFVPYLEKQKKKN